MIAIVKYNAGNIFSVYCALKRLGYEAVITDDVELLNSADKVIFPGVGDASAAMEHLRATGLDKVIKNLIQPVLGICVGMQLMCKHSEEGNVDCLGIFDCDVVKFRPSDKEMKVPHMGWNQITNLKTNLFKGIDENSFVYYVHSFHAPVNQYTIAQTNYGIDYSGALHKDNFYATQFHPEKSGSVGEQLLKNFLKI